MNSQLFDVKAAMVQTAAAERLPAYYQDDLQIDYVDLYRFVGMELVWVLRSCGTVLFPIGVGANPVFVSYWLTENHGQQVKVFRLDTRAGAHEPVQPITFEEASRLADLTPSGDVVSVLTHGLKLGIWGDNTPEIKNWHDWFDFFHSAGNDLMSAYIKRSMVAACAAQ